MKSNPITYLAGASSVNITPPVGVWLIGYHSRKSPADSIYHELKASALALSDGKRTFLLVTADLVGFYDRTEPFRTEISRKTGVPLENIMLCGSHTHTGPSIGRMRDFMKGQYGELDKQYYRQTLAKITACCEKACAEMAPATIESGTTQCDISCCKMRPEGLGETVEEKIRNLYLPTDHTVHVLTVANADKLKAVFFNYASHPSTAGPITAIGADFVGYARDRIKATFPDVVTLFTQGFSGDQKPLNPRTGRFNHELEDVAAQGYKLGDSVVALVQSQSMKKITGEMSVKQSKLTLKMRLPDEATLAEKSQGSEGQRRWAERIKSAVENSDDLEMDVYPFEIQTVSFNRSLALVALAGEMTVEHAFRLEKELGPHYRHLIPIGIANDVVGYVPVKRLIPENGYAVLSSQILRDRVGPFVEDTEDMIHGAIARQLDIH